MNIGSDAAGIMPKSHMEDENTSNPMSEGGLGIAKSAEGKNLRERAQLFLRDIGNTGLAQENSRSFGRQSDAEAMPVVVTDAPAQTLTVLQHDRDFRMGINQGFQIIGLCSGVFRMHKILDFRHSSGLIRRMPKPFS
jgi:hypothetical protein